MLCSYCLTGGSYPSDGCIESSGIWPILFPVLSFYWSRRSDANQISSDRRKSKYKHVLTRWNAASCLIGFALPFCRLAGPCWRSCHSMGTFTFGCLKSLCLQLRPCCGPCSNKTPVKNHPAVESATSLIQWAHPYCKRVWTLFQVHSCERVMAGMIRC